VLKRTKKGTKLVNYCCC